MNSILKNSSEVLVDESRLRTTQSILRIIPDIPVYSNVEGTQLTPTFRIQAGFYFLLGNGRKQAKNLRDEI